MLKHPLLPLPVKIKFRNSKLISRTLIATPSRLRVVPSENIRQATDPNRISMELAKMIVNSPLEIKLAYFFER